MRVLVVDDQRDDRELAAMVLARAGAEVRVAASAAEARDQMREFRPGALVADIGMPGEDGYEMIRQVRAVASAGPALPAVALTAYGRPEDRARALSADFAVHLVKPVAPADLVTTVAAVVAAAASGAV